MNLFSLIMFAIIGSTIHAGTGYWVIYSIWAAFYGVCAIIGLFNAD